MSTVALILAAGEQARWMGDGYKQLLRVGDETIIERIIRQCKERNVRPVVIASNHFPGFGIAQAPYFPQWGVDGYRPDRRRWTVETLLSTYDLWQPRTIVLLGDTVYSKATMDRIFNAPGRELCVFGNLVEIYALVMRFPPSELQDPTTPSGKIATDLLSTVKGAERMTQLDDRKGHGKLRKFYQRYCRLDVSGPTDHERKVLQWVDGMDYTRDVDLPKDYDALLREVVQAGRLDDLPDLNPCIEIYHLKE